jgi:hypothetical protein
MTIRTKRFTDVRARLDERRRVYDIVGVNPHGSLCHLEDVSMRVSDATLAWHIEEWSIPNDRETECLMPSTGRSSRHGSPWDHVYWEAWGSRPHFGAVVGSEAEARKPENSGMRSYMRPVTDEEVWLSHHRPFGAKGPRLE